MSATKITISASSCYIHTNGRICHKIDGLYNLPTIKRLKMIDHHRLSLNLNQKYGISRVISQSQPSSSSSPSSSNTSSSELWKKWIWGFLLTVILPAAGHKGGLPIGLKGRIDEVIERVEHVTEEVEEIAEEVVEAVEENLPDESKIKDALESVENLIKITIKEARTVEDIIHTVKDIEEDIEEVLSKATKDEDKK